VGERHLLIGALSCALTLSSVGCSNAPPNDPPPADADADVDVDSDADSDAEPDGDRDARPDGDPDAAPTSGPLTSVCAELAFTTERMCDLDGDGDLDNVLADLGSPAGDLGVMVLNTFVSGRMDTVTRLIIHMPHVDDLTGPNDDQIFAIITDGTDADEPPDPSDDFLGGETFYVKAEQLDPCGEPLQYYDDGRIEDGQVTIRGDAVPLTLYGDITFFASQVVGRVEPFGESGALSVCLHGTIRVLGQVDADIVEDMSMLELFTAGGSVVGIPGMPGLTPDVDLDGDGLERLLLDEEGHLASCVDGDHTFVEGRDCWQDDRMADAFSLVVAMSGVSAQIAGPEPGWRSRVEGTCEDPPAESLWGPSWAP
jgi:hypothetical protein